MLYNWEASTSYITFSFSLIRDKQKKKDKNSKYRAQQLQNLGGLSGINNSIYSELKKNSLLYRTNLHFNWYYVITNSTLTKVFYFSYFVLPKGSTLSWFIVVHCCLYVQNPLYLMLHVWFFFSFLRHFIRIPFTHTFMFYFDEL